MRILCLNQDQSAITFYRLKLPMLELVRHGHEVRFPTRGDKLPSDEELDWAEVIVGDRRRPVCGGHHQPGTGVVSVPGRG
jgi:hypothetical protein